MVLGGCRIEGSIAACGQTKYFTERRCVLHGCLNMENALLNFNVLSDLLALAATGFIWVRYSLVITPVNYSLAAVSIRHLYAAFRFLHMSLTLGQLLRRFNRPRAAGKNLAVRTYPYIMTRSVLFILYHSPLASNVPSRTPSPLYSLRKSLPRKHESIMHRRRVLVSCTFYNTLASFDYQTYPRPCFKPVEQTI